MEVYSERLAWRLLGAATAQILRGSGGGVSRTHSPRRAMDSEAKKGRQIRSDQPFNTQTHPKYIHQPPDKSAPPP